VEGDARNLPLPSGWYDLVVCTYNTINSLNEPSDKSKLEVLASSNRVLRSGGVMIFTSWAANAADIQLDHYKNSGFSKVIEVTEDYVHVRNDTGIDLVSCRLSPKKIEDLLSKTGFEGKVEQLTNYALACVALKK